MTIFDRYAKAKKEYLLHELGDVTEGKVKTVVIIHGMASCALETKDLSGGGAWELAWASVKKIGHAVLDGQFSSPKGHDARKHHHKHKEWIESLTCRLVESTDGNGHSITHAVCAEGWDVRPVHGEKIKQNLWNWTY
jgi:hypothetical protein